MRTIAIVVLSACMVLWALLLAAAGGALSSPHQEQEVGLVPIRPQAVTYEGCSEAQQAAIGAALAGIADTKMACEQIGADLLKCLHEKEGNILIKCCGGGCVTNPRLAGEAPMPGSWVRICGRTFNNAQRLEAVLFHELVHTCGRNEQCAEACQNACYASRGATEPDPGEGGGSCNGSGSASAVADALPASPQNLNLTGTITSTKRAYAYGEPITIAFWLQNVGATEAITVNKTWFNPNTDSLGIFDSQGQQRRARILWETEPPDLANFVVLSPGEVFSDTFAIDEEFYGTLTPDSYTLTVTYTNWFTGHFTTLYPYTFIGNLGAWTGTLRTNDLRISVYQNIYLPFIAKDYTP